MSIKRVALIKCVSYALKKVGNHPNRGGFLHYSFIVRGNTILSVGANSPGGRNQTAKYRGYQDWQGLHSELRAVTKAKPTDLDSSFDMVNIRLNKRGELRSSKPCINCVKLLKECGCKSVVYSNDNGFSTLDIE